MVVRLHQLPLDTAGLREQRGHPLRQLGDCDELHPPSSGGKAR